MRELVGSWVMVRRPESGMRLGISAGAWDDMELHGVRVTRVWSSEDLGTQVAVEDRHGALWGVTQECVVGLYPMSALFVAKEVLK